jgi:signal transduction histidine kinase/ActR/RegA family two-component response regulator
VTTQLVDQPSFLARVRHLYEHREETSRDELTLTDGRVIDRYSAPMLGPQGKYYGRVWYFRDITDRKKLEAQFIQAQKLEAVGQLAGGVAHDFNNILGVILMQLNLLQMESGLSGTVVSGLAELERHAMRGAGLTRQLLMFSRRRVMELRVFDLNGLLEDVSKMLRRLLGEDIAFELKKAAAPLLIEADAGMVEQVAMNLCINARDAMHHGGRLTVEIRRDERPPPAGGTAGSYACLAVTDTGCGMDEATKARIFEPFFTTKPVGKGTGLGLATVYGIVQQHHGWVEVDTAPNCGSTFRVFFPCREQHATEEEDAALRAAPGGDESILLVEDEAALRTSMTACLQHAGYKVVAAANGVEALGKWEEGRHEFHLLLTDHVMPERLTGMELATLLSRAKAGLKVIIMSGYTPGAKETNAPWPAGFTRLAKPFEVRKLLQIVRHCLDAK